MRIGFWGTPDFASYCLKELIDFAEIAFVVTSEDKPAGRHRKLETSPVKKIALEKNILLFQPSNLREKCFIDKIRRLKADIFVVIAYGKIIPEEIFNLPPLKTINLHPSLLPKYRGAAPIQWALINGESETGITIQRMNERMDAGDIIIQRRISIDKNITAKGLYDILLPIGAELLRDAINALASNNAKPVRQNEDEATYCGKIDRNTAQIDWRKTSIKIHNLVRGLNPKPTAWTIFKGKNIKIWQTGLVEDNVYKGIKPGAVIKHKGGRLFAGTLDGCLEILKIQPQTKKVMDGKSFINGYRINDGDHFE